MKQGSSTAPSVFTKRGLTLLVLWLAFLPATFSQVGVNTPWTWKNGPKEPFDIGTTGVNPSSRNSGSTFRDTSGNLWLFGGFTYQPAPMYYYYNDLWRYNPTTNTWTLMRTANPINAAGTYGTLGVPAAANTPGSRMDAASCVDGNGNFWLFGGMGMDASRSEGSLNDLWKYDVVSNTWVWVSGSSASNSTGHYGAQGVVTASNMPPARAGMAFWSDNAGNLWLFGGINSMGDALSDLWRYNFASNRWTWMQGNSIPNQAPNYGTIGLTAAANTPGGRLYSNAWIDTSNNLYLFGGWSNNNYFNDLWKYTPQNNQWTWIHGDNLPLQGPSTGTQGVPNPRNKPGARAVSSSFVDLQGNFWLFGGLGMNSNSPTVGGLNDLWRYSPATNQWTWMKGGDLNAHGVYGTHGVPGTANRPGSKWSAMSWSSPSSDFWLFGGLGYGETLGWGEMSDLWNLNSSSVVTSTSTIAATTTTLLTIYPNPAQSTIWFELPEAGVSKVSYRVLDASGRTSLSGELAIASTQRYRIDVSKLAPGKYVVAITTKKGMKQASFIKQ